MIEDLEAFFSEDEFAVSVTRTRLLADDVTFSAIVGLEDDGALDGHVMAPRRVMAYATGPDVIDGDRVTVSGAQTVHNGTYRVHEPKRVNDGAESRATLILIEA